MTKADLVAKIAASADLSKKDAENALNATLDAIVAAVKKGDKVQLIGFGTFESSKRAARQGINPATGAKIKIAATKVPKFKAGAKFKEAVAKKK